MKKSKQKLSPVVRFFCISAGAYMPVLEECQSQVTKYFAMGVILWITAIMASLSGGYFLSSVFNEHGQNDSFSISIALFGTFWGLAIFSLDRYMVISMQPSLNFKRKLLQATPRVLLAICLALVVSKPLELRFFKKEIDAEIASLNQDKDKTSVATNATINDRKNQIEVLEKKIISIDSVVLVKENGVEKLKQDYYNEINGVRGGISTGTRGTGPESKRKRQLWDSGRQELITLRGNSLMQKTTTEKKIGEFKDEIINIESQVLQSNDSNNGPLMQIKALHSIIDKEAPLRAADFILSLIFILFEVAPIIVKMSFKEGLYEEALKDYEGKEKKKLMKQVEFEKYEIEIQFKSKKSKLNRYIIRSEMASSTITKEDKKQDSKVIKRMKRINLSKLKNDKFVKKQYKKIIKVLNT